MLPRSHSGFDHESADLSPLEVTRFTPADAMRQVIGVGCPQPTTTGPAVQPPEGVTRDRTTPNRTSYAVHALTRPSIDINTGGLFAVAAKAVHGVHAAVNRDAA